MSRRGVIGLAAVALVAVAATTAVWAAHAHAVRGSAVALSPGAERVIGPTTPLLISYAGDGQVRVEVDGADWSDRFTRTADGFELRDHGLGEGTHAMTVDLVEDGPFGGTARTESRFAVDATAPRLAIASRPTWSPVSDLGGRTEPGATVEIRWDSGNDRVAAGEDGSFALAPAVPEGETPVQVIARDAAGNETVLERPIRFDPTPPAIDLGEIGGWIRDDDRPELSFALDEVGPSRITAHLNGEVVKTSREGGTVRLAAGQLAQGEHTLEIAVRDAAGNESEETTTFGVDTTDRLTNDLTLRPGARGRDVARLTKRLRLEGVYEGKASWVYDDKVERAVRAFQRKNDIPVDGIVRPALLERTAGRIVVDQSNYTLTLFLDGKRVKQYPIAVGTASYPTPNGLWSVTNMARNPTWIPPNSPWAAGLEPVPPGASNPLGTRWIGTSAPLIGIHGTPQSWSIGSRASHGCIRMYIGDVEELFEQVTVGMPVEIRA